MRARSKSNKYILISTKIGANPYLEFAVKTKDKLYADIIIENGDRELITVEMRGERVKIYHEYRGRLKQLCFIRARPAEWRKKWLSVLSNLRKGASEIGEEDERTVKEMIKELVDELIPREEKTGYFDDGRKLAKGVLEFVKLIIDKAEIREVEVK